VLFQALAGVERADMSKLAYNIVRPFPGYMSILEYFTIIIKEPASRLLLAPQVNF
jgi:hypothetical protein